MLVSGPRRVGPELAIDVSKEDLTDNFEKKVAVDGPVVNAGELGSSTQVPRPGFAGRPAGTWPAMDGGAQA